MSEASAQETPASALASCMDAIDEFFLTPIQAHSLAFIRIATGSMIAYIHLIWMKNLSSFMGPHALVDNTTWHMLHHGDAPDFKWTYLSRTDSMGVIWTHEIVAFMAGLLLAVGFGSRFVSILAWFTTLMTAHRMTGFLFGLDQIALMLSMYLCIANSGSVWSLDAWLFRRAQASGSDSIWIQPWWRRMAGIPQNADRPDLPTWQNGLATRLIQLHLCVIYLFGGIGKMRGEMWWDGSALWFSAASYEYQSMDLTWIGYFPLLSSVATHLTVFWEFSYCALIWPRFARPWMVWLAIVVHGGIGLFLGMITFGWMMIVANAAFVSPARFQIWAAWVSRKST